MLFILLSSQTHCSIVNKTQKWTTLITQMMNLRLAAVGGRLPTVGTRLSLLWSGSEMCHLLAHLSINSHIALARNIRDSHRSVHVEKCALPVRMRLFALLKTRNTPFPPGFVTELTTMTLQRHLCIGLWKKWVDLDVFVSWWNSIDLSILLWIKVKTEWRYIQWHILIKIVKARRLSFF